MRNRVVATGLLMIAVLGSACTGGGALARDAPATLLAPAASSRDAREGVRGPAERHAHHHAHHAHGSSELRTTGRATN